MNKKTGTEFCGKAGVKLIHELAELPPGTGVRVVGKVTELRRLTTEKYKKPMAAFEIATPEGSVKAMIFPRSFEHCGHLLLEGDVLVFSGEIMEDDALQLQITELSKPE